MHSGTAGNALEYKRGTFSLNLNYKYGFSFEELHYTMKRNNRILGLYESELSLLYEQLDRYKAGQADRKTILILINEAKFSIYNKHYQEHMLQSHWICTTSNNSKIMQR